MDRSFAVAAAELIAAAVSLPPTDRATAFVKETVQISRLPRTESDDDH